jgi:hypothetical protein
MVPKTWRYAEIVDHFGGFVKGLRRATSERLPATGKGKRPEHN